MSYADYFFKTRVFKQKRLSANNTCRVRVYGDNASKFGSRLDKVNHGSTLNLKFTNWGNTPILKLNVVKFFLNAKKKPPHFDLTTSNICLLNFVNSLNPDQATCQALSGLILFDTLLVLLKDIFLKTIYLERKFSRGQQQHKITQHITFCQCRNLNRF